MNELQNKVDQVVDILTNATLEFAPIAFANSLSAEDMVLTDIIDRHQLDIWMFSLDTGRLPQETYDLMHLLRDRYSTPLRIYFPNVKQIEAYIAENGVNGFYDSIELRKKCCHIRKVEPLRRALLGKRGWITGMRQQQAVTRAGLEVSAYDIDNRMQKFNPLLNWSHEQVWEYIKRLDVPYNKLHDNFYPSIGCTPCTRSITPGEDERAGRWWWELPGGKECGLHVGKVIPIK